MSTAAQFARQGFGPLVSVVPPDGVISPGSRIREDSRGKVPGRLGGEGWYGYDFTQPGNAPSPAEIDRWGANVGILADHYPAVDIDVDEPTLAKVVRKFCHDILGHAPTRYSRPPRMLCIYRTEEPFPKMALKLRYKGQEHTVEVLGKGRQYLLFGRHPSGVDYTWDQTMLGDPEDEGTFRPDDLTRITRIDVLRLFEALREALEPRGVECIDVDKALEVPAPPQESLLAPSIEALRELVRRLPNDYPDRDTYVGIGHAIKAAGGAANEEESLEIFQEWASRWEDGNDPEIVEADFRSFRPPFRVGWPNLEREAWQRAQELLRVRERLDEEQVRELESVAPPGLDDFEYEDGPAPIPGLKLVRIDDMLRRPKPERNWVVEGLLPQAGLSLMAAKPKVGKSTLARDLAVAVSTGRPFLGREVQQGVVVYISLEDPPWHVQQEFERLGACGENLYVFEGPVPGDSHDQLWETVAALRPSLVIVDTIQRWLRVRDLNDYAEVTAAIEPVLNLAREMGPHVLFLHHSPKGSRDDVADAALGSTALFGSVDVGLFLQRDADGRRYLTTRQRIQDPDPDIDQVAIEIDPETHQSSLGKEKFLTLLDEKDVEILAIVGSNPEIPQEDLLSQVSGTRAVKLRALRRLADSGRLAKGGRGKSGSPFHYTVVDSFGDDDLDDMGDL